MTLTSAGSWQTLYLHATLAPQGRLADMVLQAPFARSGEATVLVVVPSTATQLTVTATASTVDSPSATVSNQVAIRAHQRVSMTLALPAPGYGGDAGLGDLDLASADLASADLANARADLAGGELGHDDFMRGPVSGGWGTATDGQAWGGDSTVGTDGLWSVVNHMGLLTSKGNNVAPTAVLGPGAADVDVRITGTSAGNGFFGAVARWTSTTAWYMAQLDGTTLLIKRRDAGGGTTLMQTNFQANANTAYSIHFQAVGSTLSASAWLASATEPATFMVTATDATYPTGQTGLGAGGSLTQFTFTLFDASRH